MTIPRGFYVLGIFSICFSNKVPQYYSIIYSIKNEVCNKIPVESWNIASSPDRRVLLTVDRVGFLLLAREPRFLRSVFCLPISTPRWLLSG